MRTSKKKLKAKKQTVKKWLHENMHKPIANTMQTIERALQGHFNYDGVNGNLAQIYKFTFNERYLEPETDVGLKSRMQENCTYGSVRG